MRGMKEELSAITYVTSVSTQERQAGSSLLEQGWLEQGNGQISVLVGDPAWDLGL